MTTEARHHLVRNMDNGAFQAEFGRLDIGILNRGVLEFAQAHGILACIATDAELAQLGLVRVAILVEPPVPAPGAAANAYKQYEILLKAFNKQNDAILALKHKTIQALDEQSKHIIEEPHHGILRRTTPVIMALLTAEYATLTHQEMHALRKEWEAFVWEGGGDMVTFLVHFQDKINFLQQHGFGPTEGDMVITLMQAVRNVPLFAQMAEAAFYSAYPLVADQTCAHLQATYRLVYRRQYAQSTAAQLHMANQAIKAPAELEDDMEPFLQGIMASARDNLRHASMTPALQDKLKSAVARAIQQCLQPAQQQQNTSRHDHNNTRPGPPPKLVSGVCPLHPNAIKPHSWSKCFRNPDREKS